MMPSIFGRNYEQYMDNGYAEVSLDGKIIHSQSISEIFLDNNM